MEKRTFEIGDHVLAECKAFCDYGKIEGIKPSGGTYDGLIYKVGVNSYKEEDLKYDYEGEMRERLFTCYGMVVFPKDARIVLTIEGKKHTLCAMTATEQFAYLITNKDGETEVINMRLLKRQAVKKVYSRFIERFGLK